MHVFVKDWTDLNIVMMSSYDTGFLITLSDNNTYWTVKGQVVDNKLVITEDSEVPL